MVGKYYNFGGNFLSSAQIAKQITLHGLVGGISAELMGGKFGHGFFSAGFTKGVMGAAGFNYNNRHLGAIAGRTFTAAMVAGTVSEATGGKFRNGAKTGAIAHLFNAESKKIDPWNRKNVSGTKKVLVPVGLPYEDIVSEGEWSTYRANGLDLTDFIPQKIAVTVIKFLTFTTDQSRVVEYGQFQEYNVYEYEVVYDLNNGDVENLLYNYSSRRHVDTITQPTGRGQRFEVQTRTCYFGKIGC